ncbi:FHA domain-containing protein [Streptomyces spinoverrucosus]|uniref:FHA domain-containing protein n=1 Tax=Streptomyces spinoverrucosus TaxID=284043 RepID=UPI0018C415AE|nr:FHA domain-containing protein [Streptomyces spinoverrucosus]MBG0852516.1 FHA domain-containing protein [Streptomyces spinoverrucosus]
MNRRESLARGAPPAAPDTLHARSAAGGITAAPEPGRLVCFGRAPGCPATELYVGGDDLRVSRRQGELTYHHGHWWLHNTGRRPLRLPHDELLTPRTAPLPVPSGYTPLFVQGLGHREYLIELYVTDPARHSRDFPQDRPPLDDDERLLLVVLGQRYLRHESDPRPFPSRKALQQLRFLRPETDWEAPGIEHRVAEIGARLSADEAVPLHSLLRDLVDATHLVPPDLALLDRELDG